MKKISLNIIILLWFSAIAIGDDGHQQVNEDCEQAYLERWFGQRCPSDCVGECEEFHFWKDATCIQVPYESECELTQTKLNHWMIPGFCNPDCICMFGPPVQGQERDTWVCKDEPPLPNSPPD